MSCGCLTTPCTCAAPKCEGDLCFVDPCEPVNPDPNCGSKCNRDLSNNIWYVPDQPGFDCKCKLDNMTYGQVIRVLEMIPYANKQLAAITDDPCLLMLAREIKLIVPVQEDDERSSDRINANTLPYYTRFAGNMDGSVRGKRTSSRTRSS